MRSSLGRGGDADGTLPRLAVHRVNRAAELFAWETATRIIFSGRCSLMTDVIPAVTEARAMAEYAATPGLPRDALFVEGGVAGHNWQCVLRDAAVARLGALELDLPDGDPLALARVIWQEHPGYANQRRMCFQSR